jgi:SMP-30/Gluconolactonase/LRE-like region
MTREVQPDPESMISRRSLVHGLAIAAGATLVGASGALAQQGGELGPPSTITSPPRDFGPGGAPTTYFWDPDIIAVDPSFNNLAQPNAAIKRLYTGLLWAEGPAWSAQGRYLLWSDIPNNRQMRWSEDDGRVSVFRSPSNNSNGNSFDFQGRQLSCEHPPAGSCATSTTVRCPYLPTTSTAKSSTPPTMSSPARMAATGSPTRPMEVSSTKVSLIAREVPAMRAQAQSADRPAGRLRAGQTRTPAAS